MQLSPVNHLGFLKGSATVLTFLFALSSPAIASHHHPPSPHPRVSHKATVTPKPPKITTVHSPAKAATNPKIVSEAKHSRKLQKNKTTKAAAKPSPASRKIGTGVNAGNCVAYLKKERGIKFPPVNLTSFSAKESIINSKTPQKGGVAIIRVSGKYAENGHVAEVTKVTKNEIVLREANYPSAGYYERTLKGDSIKSIMAANNIEGFYNP